MKIGDIVRYKPPWENRTGIVIGERKLFTISEDQPLGNHSTTIAYEEELEVITEEERKR
jgi:hypothetical protein